MKILIVCGDSDAGEKLANCLQGCLGQEVQVVTCRPDLPSAALDEVTRTRPTHIVFDCDKWGSFLGVIIDSFRVRSNRPPAPKVFVFGHRPSLEKPASVAVLPSTTPLELRRAFTS